MNIPRANQEANTFKLIKLIILIDNNLKVIDDSGNS